MIQNLNRLSFAPYGQVLAEQLPNRGLPAGEDWVQNVLSVDVEQAEVCVCQGQIYLDFEDGMTVLAVMDGAQTRCFYLDKPVLLRPQLRYAIVPFQQQCRVRIAYLTDQPPQPCEPFSTEGSLKLSRRIQVGNIYTAFYQEKEKGFFFKGERHTALELTYVDKGRLHSIADGVDQLMQQGDATIYDSNQWHMQYADDDSAPSFVTISFEMAKPLPQDFAGCKVTMAAQDVSLIQQIIAETEHEDAFSGDMIVCLLEQLLVRMLRALESADEKHLQTPASLRVENEIISRAMRYVAEHICERLSVGKVADAIDVSASHLTALFHKNLHIAPGEYIRRSKLEESKLMIKEGAMNFTQIAQALNYSTVHHFSRQFKEKYGITPSEYARAIK